MLPIAALISIETSGGTSIIEGFMTEVYVAVRLAENYIQRHGMVYNIIHATVYAESGSWVVEVYRHGVRDSILLSVSVERQEVVEMDVSPPRDYSAIRPVPDAAHPGELAAEKVSRCEMSHEEAFLLATGKIPAGEGACRGKCAQLAVSDLNWSVYITLENRRKTYEYLHVDIDSKTRQCIASWRDSREP